MILNGQRQTNILNLLYIQMGQCSFCLCPDTLLHVVAECQSHLQRFTWRHDSILNFVAETLQTTCVGQIYADLPGFRTPSIISGDAYQPDLLLITPDDKLYIVELTVGFETNLHNNVERKKAKYEDLIEELRDNFVFVNLWTYQLVFWVYLTENAVHFWKC